MRLTDAWFTAIAALWVGYLFLEGFDFGVGILLPAVTRTRAERDAVLHTIAPVWDGNETWLVVAAGATFAAFPDWYASLFSAFYLPVLAVLVALILRGVGLESRGGAVGPRGRRAWERCVFWGSLVPAVAWGVVFADMVRGVPLDARHRYVGTVLDLLHPYALAGGLATLAILTLHGATFLALRTVGDPRERARRIVRRAGPVAVAVEAGFLGATQAVHGSAVAAPVGAAAVLALLGALAATRAGRDGLAFACSGAAVALTTAAVFADLYPAVLRSTVDPAGTLTVTGAAATPYALAVTGWVALAFMPLVLLYQGFTYWVFRRRVGVGTSGKAAGEAAA